MDLELPIVFEIGSLVILTLILAADLLLILKRPHIPSTKESTLWVVFYIALALVFAALMWLFAGGEFAGQFVAGWLTEYSLSIDNLFVFVLIMGQFAVPRRYQQEVLMVGIIIALVLRGSFILVGSAIIENFSPIFYVFGAFLVYTAIRQAFPGRDHGSDVKQENFVVRLIRRQVDITDHYDGAKLRTVVDGKKMFTPMIIVFAAIGVTDLLFAIDSIPAIFGITTSPFIVFTANIFALMGLRQLYFLLGGLLRKLVYLSLGLSVILAFIGVKLVFHALHEYHLDERLGIPFSLEIPIWLSLLVIIGTLIITAVASLVKSRWDEDHVAPTGSGSGSAS